MMRFENKSVLVTGAGSGIGRATAVRLASEGAVVACADVSREGLTVTIAEVEKLGGRAFPMECDVSSEVAVASAVAGAVEKLGKLDVLCNVAGILRSDRTHELALQAWSRIIDVNLTGTFLMCRAAIPHLLKTRGNIVNMCSTAALGSHPWMAAYAASKGGVLSFTRAIAVEYVKDGLRANCVIPGGIKTPLHGQFVLPEGADFDLMKGAIPFVEFAGPEHVASAVAFIASDDGKYMNGAELRVDGGAMS